MPEMTLKHLLFLILMTLAGNLFAQSANRPVSESRQSSGTSLALEIRNLERESARQGAAPVERHAALVRLARLRQLSGDIEGAARNWLEAAAAIPGVVDDNALLSCAYCLAAMGEWERASVALEPLVSKNTRARFLDISIKAIQSGDTSALAAIADTPAFAGMKHEILFLLWKISRAEAAEMWRQRLTAEFPQTPEGRLAITNDQLVMSPSPFWFLLGRLDSLPLSAEREQGTGNREQRTESREQRAETREQGTGTREQRPETRESPAAAPASARVQTGVFSREVNAQAQAANLRNAGFFPVIEQRGDRWAVTVPAGQDASRTINDLRAAGFDSFLIR